MPSFDVVSEVDNHELTNAVDQANREVGNRFDFKGVDAAFDFSEKEVKIKAEAEFQVQQMLDMLQGKIVKRGIDITALKPAEEIEITGSKATLTCQVVQGIDGDTARKIVKHVKDLKMKVQVAIQGEKLRVTGNKRDDLQRVIAELRQEDFGVPLQYENFRD
jgi:uncharacterized protein YajQ (UPF0234 family)